MDGGALRCGGQARVDDDEVGWVGAGESVQHARPEDGLRVGHVVPYEEEAGGVVDVCVAARLAVGAEALAHGGGGGGGAQAGVAVPCGGSGGRPCR